MYLKQLKCENCDSTSFDRVGGYLVCAYCNTAYLPDREDLPDSPERAAKEDGGKEIASASEDFIIRNGVLEKYIGKAPVVTIPSHVKKIGPEAFANTSVTYVGLPEELTSIGKGAFRGCKYLTSLDLPEELEELGDEAFMESGLKSVVFPEVFFMYLDDFGKRVIQRATGGDIFPICVRPQH